MEVKIIVASHKKYQMPNDDIYLPIHVGREGKEDMGFQGDNEGENISQTNFRFCELTGVYWAWKNLKADYIGLVHYRRYFTNCKLWERIGKDKFSYILGKEEILNYFKQYDLIVPKKRKYYIESIYSHFIHLPYTYEKDIQLLRKTIAELEPDYLIAFDTVMNRRWAHMFNMFIMKYEKFNQYCEWMFSILFEVDKKIDVSKYTQMEARAVAYFGEFMLDVWNEKQKLHYIELPVMYMEKQNWLIKGGKFLGRKVGLFIK